MKKKNSKPNPLIQTLVYRSNIYYSKIYQKEIEKTKQNFFWNERNMTSQTPCSTLHLKVWTWYFRHNSNSHNILRLFDILPNFSVTTSETKRDC